MSGPLVTVEEGGLGAQPWAVIITRHGEAIPRTVWDRYETQALALKGAIAARAYLDGRRSVTWQPIATAPRDGTEVDVWAGERVVDVYWVATAQTPAGAALLLDGGGWVQDDDHGFTWALDPQPTHWMPKPEAPR